MTPKYWIRIALGMLAIFAVGMLINCGLMHGKRHVTELVEGTGPVNVPLLGMAFRLNDEKVGGISRLQLLRSQPRRVDSAIVTVKLNDVMFADRFADCRLTVRDGHNLNDKTSFFCAQPADSAAMDLVPFGHVVLMPSGQQVAMWVPASVAADLREIDSDAMGDSGNVDVQGSPGGLSVKVNGQEVVSMRGDSTGGSLVVRDGKGRPIVTLHGDSTGATVEVTDSAAASGNRWQTKARRGTP